MDSIVTQHAEEAAFLWLLRNRAVGSPHYRPEHLARLDNRIEAHVDGLRVAGEAGWELACAELQHEEAGEVFAAGVLALESRDRARIERVLEVAARVAETVPGFVSALGWVERAQLQGTVRDFLAADPPFLRRLGVAACAVHRVDPGAVLERAIDDPDPSLRARALKAAGELGRADLIDVLRERLRDEDATCRFWAAWSAMLAGDRGQAVIALQRTAMVASPLQFRALALAPRVLSADAARDWLRTLSADPDQRRALITAVGAYGDPHYLPWLITQMEIPALARAAGEAFSMITGIDLAYDDLDGEWPEGFEAGPTENPEDEDVGLDPDEDLPWPAPHLISRWWEENSARFVAGGRYLCGRPITDAHCRDVLRSGYQRQRIAAALELALMRPDRPLFEWRAPAFRQKALLAARQA
ncbi:MAG: TIGR02270 family protein [Rhodospirillales bacterium]